MPTSTTMPQTVTEIDVRGPDGDHVARYRIREDGDYRIGRDRAYAHLLIADPSVSRRHAQVRRKGAQLWLADAGSLNGTRLATDMPTATPFNNTFVFRDWPEGVTANIGVFTLQWRSVEELNIAPEAELLRTQFAVLPRFSAGSWRTRLLMIFVAILPVSLIVSLAMGGWKQIEPAPLTLAALIATVGLVLDPIYRRLMRVDAKLYRERSPVFAASSFVLECAIALTIERADILPAIDACRLARIDRLTRQLICVDYTLPLSVALVEIGAILAAVLVVWYGLLPISGRRA